jgi:hypothetical protein
VTAENAIKNAINNIAVQAINTPARGQNGIVNEPLEAKTVSGKEIGEMIHASRVKAVSKSLES